MEQILSLSIDERLRLPTFRNIIVSTRLLGYLTVKMKAVESFETSDNVQPQALRHTPENLSLKQHRCENLKFLSAFSVTPEGLGSIWACGLGLLQEVSDVIDTECVTSSREQTAHNEEDKCDISNT